MDKPPVELDSVGATGAAGAAAGADVVAVACAGGVTRVLRTGISSSSLDESDSSTCWGRVLSTRATRVPVCICCNSVCISFITSVLGISILTGVSTPTGES